MLRLPPELRNRITDEVVRHGVDTIALTSTCRQLRNERHVDNVAALERKRKASTAKVWREELMHLVASNGDLDEITRLGLALVSTRVLEDYQASIAAQGALMHRAATSVKQPC